MKLQLVGGRPVAEFIDRFFGEVCLLGELWPSYGLTVISLISYPVGHNFLNY